MCRLLPHALQSWSGHIPFTASSLIIMPFTVLCLLCRKKFKTGLSLRKHFELRHNDSSFKEENSFEDELGNLCENPKAVALCNEEAEDYPKWLGVLVERINASLVPDHPGKCLTPPIFKTFVAVAKSFFFFFLHFSTGKWCHVDCFQVPKQYFQHILYRLESPMLDSVRDVSHRRQPIFKRAARRLSFKIFDKQKFRGMLEEQDTLPFKPAASFCNHEEVSDLGEMNAEEALEFAKARARRPTS